MELDRRSFLKGGTAAAAGIALGAGPFEGFVARAAGGPGRVVTPPGLVPTADLRDGVARLAVPPGFSYRSFDAVAPAVPPAVFTGTDVPLPGVHDGMAAFNASKQRVLLIRNHEVNGPGTAFSDDGPTYDPAARGGNTYVLVDHEGNVERTWPALIGTQMNCAGGAMPWGSWITCEETVNGPDVFDDFTRGSDPPTTYVRNAQLTEKHGYIFEVPTSAQASAVPIRAAGRFAHEAAAFDPNSGSIYLTEDNFGFGSGFYRYDPPVDPRRAKSVHDGGSLWMLGVAGLPQANLSGALVPGTRYPVAWIRIDDPDPTFPMDGDVPTVINNEAISAVGRQGWDGGAAVFSRLEGAAYDKGAIYFTATQGGGAPAPVDWDVSAEPTGFGNGNGQVFAYHPNRNELEVVYQSSGPDDLDLPDNITTSPRGTLILCEDNPRANMLQALTRFGQLIPIADHLERPGVEFAGSTFSPNGNTLFVNLQASSGAMSLAMWGPWSRLGV